MMRKTMHWVGLAALWLALGVGLGGPAGADWRSDYRDGKNALIDNRFSDAEQLFRKAIKAQVQERSGGPRRSYVPHYYLGVALASQGRCREALEAWTESERQGKVQKVDLEGGEIAARQKNCEQALRQIESAQLAAKQALAQARKSEQTLRRVRDNADLKPVWSEGSPSFADRENEAVARLSEADQKLTAAAQVMDTRPYQAVRTMANRSAEEFDQLTSEAEARLESIREATSSGLERLEAAEASAQAELRKIAYLEPFPPVLKKHVAALNSALSQSTSKKAAASSAELQVLRGALADATDQVRQAALAPPRALRTAVEAFLAGRYGEVLTTLDGQTYRGSRASGQTCLLRAASRHALFTLTGEQDAEMANTLHQEVVGCREILPGSAISEKFFSPRFIEFYENPPEPPPILMESEESAEPAAAASETESN